VGHRGDSLDRDRENHTVDLSQRFIALGLRRSSVPANPLHDQGGRRPMSFVTISAGPEKVAEG
jgi:hypothetical protein